MLDPPWAVVPPVFELEAVESHDVPPEPEEGPGDAGQGRSVVGILFVQALPIDAGVGAPLAEMDHADRIRGVVGEVLSRLPELVLDVEVFGKEIEAFVLVYEMRSHDGVGELLVPARLRRVGRDHVVVDHGPQGESAAALPGEAELAPDRLASVGVEGSLHNFRTQPASV